MAATLHVLYPVSDDGQFNYEYYASTHAALVREHMGPHLESDAMVKGLAGGPDVPSPYYAIYSATFSDMEALQAALGAAGPVLADIPNYTNVQPIMMIGEKM